jgi:hypothetical protein
MQASIPSPSSSGSRVRLGRGKKAAPSAAAQEAALKEALKRAERDREEYQSVRAGPDGARPLNISRVFDPRTGTFRSRPGPSGYTHCTEAHWRVARPRRAAPSCCVKKPNPATRAVRCVYVCAAPLSSLSWAALSSSERRATRPLPS